VTRVRIPLPPPVTIPCSPRWFPWTNPWTNQLTLADPNGPFARRKLDAPRARAGSNPAPAPSYDSFLFSRASRQDCPTPSTGRSVRKSHGPREGSVADPFVDRRAYTPSRLQTSISRKSAPDAIGEVAGSVRRSCCTRRGGCAYGGVDRVLYRRAASTPAHIRLTVTRCLPRR
jgi:hypothetical protein